MEIVSTILYQLLLIGATGGAIFSYWRTENSYYAFFAPFVLMCVFQREMKFFFSMSERVEIAKYCLDYYYVLSGLIVFFYLIHAYKIYRRRPWVLMHNESPNEKKWLQEMDENPDKDPYEGVFNADGIRDTFNRFIFMFIYPTFIYYNVTDITLMKKFILILFAVNNHGIV